ncbi:MAG: holo-ACP synthase [Nocardioidaceae bacterium]|nr:holo-ACP synthase [Nocardioidaceae bacterium]MCL2613114.1 holo-ACP synthase [Nocardioidaceae bacterium]
MSPVSVGVDIVHVPSFAEQLAQPGSRFASVFTVGERAEAVRRELDGDRLSAYWAARWAAREALVKAWSTALFGEAPPAGEEVMGEVEVAVDAWGRPRLYLHGGTRRALASYDAQVSLSHDGDSAVAVVLLSLLAGRQDEEAVLTQVACAQATAESTPAQSPASAARR